MSPKGRDVAPGRLSRRHLLAGAGAVTAGTVAGCFGGTDSSDTDDVEDITFLHFETDDERRAAIESLGEAFAAEEGIELTQAVEPEADLPTRIQADVAAGTLPNVAALNHSTLHAAADAVASESAERVIERIGEDRFYDSLLDLVRGPDGNYRGVPLYTWPQLTIYRQELFEERGLPEPRTWEDLLEAASALHDPDDDQFGIILGTAPDQYTLQCFSGVALSNNARVFDDDGEIVFDSDEMIEALEFYAELAQYTPPGEIDAGSIGPAYDNQQAHLYSGNSFSLYFNALGLEEGETMPDGVVPSVTNERSSTFGEVVSTATFAGQSAAEIEAAERWQSFVRGADDESRYVEWCHIQPGGFQPVLEAVPEMDAYRENEIIQRWDDELVETTLPESIRQSERFGFRDGESFPAIGQITGNFLIAGAVSDVVDGENAREIAEETADEMRDLIE